MPHNHDDLLAQTRSLVGGIEKLDGEIAEREGTLEVMRADRDAMAKRLGSIERFLASEDVELPYEGRKGL